MRATTNGWLVMDANEKEQRSKFFQENVHYIESSNNVKNKGYKLAVNEFTDLTNQELTSTRNRFKAHECNSPSTSAFRYANVIEVAIIKGLEKERICNTH